MDCVWLPRGPSLNKSTGSAKNTIHIKMIYQQMHYTFTHIKNKMWLIMIYFKEIKEHGFVIAKNENLAE